MSEQKTNKATHSYVGSLACGCGCAIVVDEPDYPKDTAKSVAEFIKAGLNVQRFIHDQAVEMFIAKCADYPHTDWQRKIEAARQKRQAIAR